MSKRQKLTDRPSRSKLKPRQGVKSKGPAMPVPIQHQSPSSVSLSTPHEWQRCSEGFATLQDGGAEKTRPKVPAVPAVKKKPDEGLTVSEQTSAHQKTPTAKPLRNFGQKWIQSEEMFEGIGVQIKGGQEDLHAKVSPSLSRRQTPSTTSTKAIVQQATPDTEVEAICWSDSDSDESRQQFDISTSVSVSGKTTQRRRTAQKLRKKKCSTSKAHPVKKQDLNLRPQDSSESDPAEVICPSESDEDETVLASSTFKAGLDDRNDPSPSPSSKTSSSRLEIECIGSPRQASASSSTDNSKPTMSPERLLPEWDLASPTKEKDGPWRREAGTPPISSCGSSQVTVDSGVSPAAGGLTASEWVKQVKQWQTTPSKDPTRTPPGQGDSAKKKKKFTKGGLAEQMSRLLLREKSAARMWRHQHGSQDDHKDLRILTVTVRRVETTRSLTLAHCSVVRSPATAGRQTELDARQQQTDRGQQTCCVFFSPQFSQQRRALKPGALVHMYPPWRQLDKADGGTVVLCARYLVADHTPSPAPVEGEEGPGVAVADVMGAAADHRPPQPLSTTTTTRGRWMCPCSVDEGLAASRCPAQIYPFLPASLVQMTLTTPQSATTTPAAAMLHTVTGNEGAPPKRTLTFDTLLESIDKVRSGDNKVLPGFLATVLRVFSQPQKDNSSRRSVLVEDSQGTVALVSGADCVPGGEGQLTSLSSLRVHSRTNADRDPALFSVIAAAWLDKVKSEAKSQECDQVPCSQDAFLPSQMSAQAPGFCYLLEVDRCGNDVSDSVSAGDWMSVHPHPSPPSPSPLVCTTLAQTLQCRNARVSIVAKVIFDDLRSATIPSSEEEPSERQSGSSCRKPTHLFLCDHSLVPTECHDDPLPAHPEAQERQEDTEKNVGDNLPPHTKLHLQKDCAAGEGEDVSGFCQKRLQSDAVNAGVDSPVRSDRNSAGEEISPVNCKKQVQSGRDSVGEKLPVQPGREKSVGEDSPVYGQKRVVRSDRDSVEDLDLPVTLAEDLPGYVKVQVQGDCGVDSVTRSRVVQRTKKRPPYLALLRDVWCVDGVFLADKFSALLALDAEDRETVSVRSRLAPDLCTVVRDCQVHLPPVSVGAKVDSLVSISGVVQGVDEKSAFSWEECDGCGSDQLAIKSNTGCLVCLGCKKSVTSPLQRMKMEVAVGTHTDPSLTVTVNLLQSTIEELLPDEGDEEGYDVSCVLHKSLGPINCILTHRHRTGGHMFSASQLAC